MYFEKSLEQNFYSDLLIFMFNSIKSLFQQYLLTESLACFTAESHDLSIYPQT